jgi:hypothetical protein
MSDIIPTPHDAAIAVITERARELDTEILGHQRCIDVATASRNELLDLVATLSRKPRARRTRPMPAGVTLLLDDTAEESPRPTVFAVPGATVTGEAA